MTCAIFSIIQRSGALKKNCMPKIAKKKLQMAFFFCQSARTTDGSFFLSTPHVLLKRKSWKTDFGGKLQFQNTKTCSEAKTCETLSHGIGEVAMRHNSQCITSFCKLLKTSTRLYFVQRSKRVQLVIMNKTLDFDF